MKWLAVMLLLAGAAQAQLPPTPPKALGAGTQLKGAQVQMQITLPKTNYLVIQFDVDPRNGQPGYVNFTTYLQTSNDLLTWRDIASVSGPTNGAFSVPVRPGINQFFRTRWDNTQTR